MPHQEELTYNEQIMRAMISHQIGLLAFTGRVRNRIWKLLDATEGDLRAQIDRGLRRDVGKPLVSKRLARTERVIAGLRETRVSAWDEVDAVWVSEMRALALAEPAFVSAIVDSTVGFDLGMTAPSARELRQIVDSRPFLGATLKQWADRTEAADVRRIADQVKIGMVQGESTRQIAKRVVGTVRMRGRDGVTAVTRRNAEAITRTAVNSISAEARQKFYEENADVLPSKLFIATLDAGTTLICAGFDGQVFAIDEGPVFALHHGERSLYGPVVDGEVAGKRPVRNFTAQQLVGEYAEQNDLDVKLPGKGSRSMKAMRAVVPKGHKGSFEKFARKRMRELTGRAPAKLNFQTFLEGQSAQFQNDYLGPTKGKLFRKGGLRVEDMRTPQGREFTLEELAGSHAAEFERAGLDPTAFLKMAG